MALSELERVWRAWQALTCTTGRNSCTCFVSAPVQEREERLAANRRAAGEPVTHRTSTG